MNQLEQICKKYERMSDAERQTELLKYGMELVPAMAKHLGGEDKAKAMFRDFLISAALVDNKLGDTEFDLVNMAVKTTTGQTLDYAALRRRMIQERRDAQDVRRSVEQQAKQLSEDLRWGLVYAALIVFSADHRVGYDELRWLSSIVR